MTFAVYCHGLRCHAEIRYNCRRIDIFCVSKKSIHQSAFGSERLINRIGCLAIFGNKEPGLAIGYIQGTNAYFFKAPETFTGLKI